eukprot:SAG22_NODE_44_length_24912_cov_33.648894_9_plen_53_part_00
MVENVLATKIEHKVDRVFKRDLIKVHYQCAHCMNFIPTALNLRICIPVSFIG